MLVTFLGLHDVKRFMNEPGATPAGMKLAFTFLLTARGTPMIYYGDEIAMPGGEDPDNRRDYPWTTRTSEQEDMFGYVRKLLHLRAEMPSLRRAPMETLAISEQAWVYRRGDAVVVINNGNAAAHLAFPYEGRLRGRLADSGEVASRNGVLEITTPARSAEIYMRN
jgi:glycosidase